MSLETLEGLPEEVANLYKKGEDGKFHLVGEAGDGLKSALQKERERANAAEKALKERERQEADSKAAKERDELERKGEYEKLKASLEAETKATRERAEALEAKLRNGARDRAAMEAIQAAGGIPKALLPHVQGALEVVQDGEDYKVIVKGDPGKKLDAFIAGLKTEMPWGFNGSGASGGGAPQSGGAAHTKTWAEMNLKERTELHNQNPTLAAQLQGAN